MTQIDSLIITAVIILGLWELIWKGLALWHSAKNNHKNWYTAILILNTMGILPIIYLKFFKNKKQTPNNSKKNKKKTKKKKKTKRK